MERLIRLGLISRLKQRLFGNDEASPTLPESPGLAATGDEAVRRFAETCRARGLPTYEADGLTVWEKDTSFLRHPRFVRAYQTGMQSGHKISRPKGSSEDLHIEWRAFVCCWAAWHARQLPGDFVECGTNTGMMSLAVCHYIDFNATGKAFYLFDTFRGIPEEQMSAEERALGRLTENEAWYEECYELTLANFRPFPRARLIRGRVPDTLPEAPIDRVCYLSIDMNIAKPERAAIEFFWDKLVPGAPVILDDYGWLGYWPQKRAMDEFAASRGAMILPMPTGQGLLLKG
jgi:O-methyltransferase